MGAKLLITQSRVRMNRPTMFLLLILIFLSTLYVFQHVILPHVPERMEHESKILAGEQEPPYRYRVLKPVVAHNIQLLLARFVPHPETRHLSAYFVLAFLSFAGIFYLFYVYLRRFFADRTAVIGILLLQLVIPFTVSGYYQEGDFITLFFYLLSFQLIFTGRDRWLPVVIGLAALNREQAIFIVVFYAAYFISQQAVNRRSVFITFASLAVFIAVYIGLRALLGVPPSRYTVAVHVAYNTNLPALLMSIIPLWSSTVMGFVVLGIAAYRKSSRFFRLGLLSLIPYAVLFFLFGRMDEIGKFLPAYLILIPMSLQSLTQEYNNDLDLPQTNQPRWKPNSIQPLERGGTEKTE